MARLRREAAILARPRRRLSPTSPDPASATRYDQVIGAAGRESRPRPAMGALATFGHRFLGADRARRPERPAPTTRVVKTLGGHPARSCAASRLRAALTGGGPVRALGGGIAGGWAVSTFFMQTEISHPLGPGLGLCAAFALTLRRRAGLACARSRRGRPACAGAANDPFRPSSAIGSLRQPPRTRLRGSHPADVTGCAGSGNIPRGRPVRLSVGLTLRCDRNLGLIAQVPGARMGLRSIARRTGL